MAAALIPIRLRQELVGIELKRAHLQTEVVASPCRQWDVCSQFQSPNKTDPRVTRRFASKPRPSTITPHHAPDLSPRNFSMILPFSFTSTLPL